MWALRAAIFSGRVRGLVSSVAEKERLEPLRHKRMVFIFDECHRSQFGDNHEAIKAFFPKAQLFGFTGTPIFKENASYQQIEGQQTSYKTTEDIYQKQLHAYTITHAIEDRNVLRYSRSEKYAPSNAGTKYLRTDHLPVFCNASARYMTEERGQKLLTADAALGGDTVCVSRHCAEGNFGHVPFAERNAFCQVLCQLGSGAGF